MAEDLGIGVDLGATRVRVCLGRRDGHILWRESREMRIEKEVDGYVGQVVSAIREAKDHAQGRKVVGAAIASIGPLDLAGGKMSSPANLPYRAVPLVGPIREATGLEVTLINDANAAVLGEKCFGAGKEYRNLAYLTISTGIGGGAIVDGHLLSGKDGNAAEVGHVVVDPEGHLTCGCGRSGHWEAYCSGRNIPRLAALLAGQDKPSELGGKLGGHGGEVDAKLILRAASSGNRFAMRVASEVGRLNALGVANIVNMFDPSLITVGGAVALNNENLILGSIIRLVPRHALNRVPQIRVTPLGDDAGMLGALRLALGPEGRLGAGTS